MFDKYSDYLLIVHQNIRSVRKNFDLFALKLKALEKLPHIIVLSEIWIEEHELPLFTLPGYNVFAKCNQSYRAGGVMTYVTDSLLVQQLNIMDLLTADHLHLRIKIPNKTDIDMVAVYRLQQFNEDQFCMELDNMLHKINNKNLIICGDLNINLLKPSNSADNYLTKMAGHGLESQINEPTRVTMQSSSLIDHVFIRRGVNHVMESDSWVTDTQVTDHYMIVTCIKCEKIPSAHKTYQCSSINFQLLNSAILCTDWNAVYLAETVSLAYETFLDILENCVAFSRREISKYKNKNKILKPWMNKELLIMVNKKNELYKQCKKQPNNIPLKEEYANFKNNLANNVNRQRQPTADLI